MLSVLHISATDNLGGSGRSAYRIHTSLRKMGHRSRMLVSYRVTDDPDVGMIWQTQFWRAADYFCGVLTDSLSLQYWMYPSSFKLLSHPWFRETDILQLYNIHGKYFTHRALPVLSRRRPVVWRLSDMWPMTGHCAYSYDCERWKTGCGSCPILDHEPSLRTDRTALLWRKKKQVYERSNIVVVAPSKWIEKLAAQSPLLGRFPVYRIPNGLNTEVFSPVPKSVAREVLGLNPAEKILLFSSVETTAKRKGGEFLPDTLRRLKQQSGVECRVLVVGNRAESWANSLPYPVTTINTVKDDRMLSIIYSASDVFVYPTVAENLPNGVLESMACGTPTVAFNVGGVPDAVRPDETGYLAAYKDSEDLARGIRLLLEDNFHRERLGRRCREIAETEYTMELQAERFQQLYKEILLPGRRTA